MAALSASKEALPAEVRSMLDEHMESDRQLATKQLHKLVAQQSKAHKELGALRKARSQFVREWTSYLESLTQLLEKQMGQKSEAMASMAEAEASWQAQLGEATRAIRQQTAPDTLTIEDSDEDAMDAEIDVDAAAEASRQKAVEHSQQQEQGLLSALQSAVKASDAQAQQYRERTPRRQRGAAAEVKKEEPGERPGTQPGRQKRRQAAAPWRGPVNCHMEFTGPISAPRPAFTSVLEEPNYVSRWQASLLALCLRFEVQAVTIPGYEVNIFEFPDPRTELIGEFDLGSVDNNGEDETTASPYSYETLAFRPDGTLGVHGSVPLADAAAVSFGGRLSSCSFREDGFDVLANTCTKIFSEVVQAVQSSRLQAGRHLLPLRLTLGNRFEDRAANAWRRQANAVFMRCPVAPDPSGAMSQTCSTIGRGSSWDAHVSFPGFAVSRPRQAFCQHTCVPPVASTTLFAARPSEGRPAIPGGFSPLRLQLAAMVPVQPEHLDRPEQRNVALSCFRWITAHRAAGAVTDETHRGRYVIFATDAHLEIRRLPIGFTINDIVADILGTRPHIRSIRFLRERVSGLPPVQVAAHLREDPDDAWILPVDFRPLQGRICTLPIPARSDGDRIVAHCVHDCPTARLPPGAFQVQLPDHSPITALVMPPDAPDFVIGAPYAPPAPLQTGEVTGEFEQEGLGLFQVHAAASPQPRVPAPAPRAKRLLHMALRQDTFPSDRRGSPVCNMACCPPVHVLLLKTPAWSNRAGLQFSNRGLIIFGGLLTGIGLCVTISLLHSDIGGHKSRRFL